MTRSSTTGAPERTIPKWAFPRKHRAAGRGRRAERDRASVGMHPAGTGCRRHDSGRALVLARRSAGRPAQWLCRVRYMRMTIQTLTVLKVLLDDPTAEQYGLELTEKTGLRSGTLYPILMRLEREGWADSAWEDSAIPQTHGRPRRRYYCLSKNA